MSNGTATGLQGASAIAGLLGTAIGGIRNEQQLKKQAKGQETAAQRALRTRLAAQNEQSALRVAHSQPGVNPALAQRNANAALAQAQVGTNAQLAQQGLAQSQRAQEQLAASRQQRIQGAVSMGAGMLNSLGASQSVDAAQQQLQGGSAAAPAPDLVPQVTQPQVTPATFPVAAEARQADLGPAAFGQTAVPVVDSSTQEVSNTMVPQDPQPAAQGASADLMQQAGDPAATAVSPAGQIEMGSGQVIAQVDQLAAEQGPEAATLTIADLRDEAVARGDHEMDELLYQKALMLEAQRQRLLELEQVVAPAVAEGN